MNSTFPVGFRTVVRSDLCVCRCRRNEPESTTSVTPIASNVQRRIRNAYVLTEKLFRSSHNSRVRREVPTATGVAVSLNFGGFGLPGAQSAVCCSSKRACASANALSSIVRFGRLPLPYCAHTTFMEKPFAALTFIVRRAFCCMSIGFAHGCAFVCCSESVLSFDTSSTWTTTRTCHGRSIWAS